MKIKFELKDVNDNILIQGKEIEASSISMEMITAKIIETEQFLEKILGKRFHINLVHIEEKEGWLK